jgi:tetratricopeptide (TPR) repeat protein
LLALATAALVAAGCDRPAATDDQTTGSVTGDEARAARAGWPAAADAHLDSANSAFSAKSYQDALRHYQAMLDLGDMPENAKVTAYFGLYMTHSALGDTVAARAAADRLQELAPNASLMHGPMMGDSTSASPAPPDDSIHRGRGQ